MSQSASSSPAVATSAAEVTLTSDLPSDLTFAPEFSEAAAAPTSPQTSLGALFTPSFWKTFASTFITIFLAELGDKTQVSTLLLSAQSHQPWIVFTGAALALVATSAIGVWVGCWLAKRIAPQTIERSAGVLMLVLAVLMVWEVVQG